MGVLINVVHLKQKLYLYVRFKTMRKFRKTPVSRPIRRWVDSIDLDARDLR